MITCCPYTGPRQAKTSIAKIQHLTRPDTFAQKDKYILHFADKQCRNESIVGGKGYSLAILTSIITDDVCTLLLIEKFFISAKFISVYSLQYLEASV